MSSDSCLAAFVSVCDLTVGLMSDVDQRGGVSGEGDLD